MQKLLPLGIVEHPESTRATDYLFRISLKCVVLNDDGEVLVVKETDRGYWDLPGGGMDHGESIHEGVAREMHEEVSLTGDFSYKILTVEDPQLLVHNFYQMRLILRISPDNMIFSPGSDADEVSFVHPDTLKNSPSPNEQLVYEYSRLASQKTPR